MKKGLHCINCKYSEISKGNSPCSSCIGYSRLEPIDTPPVNPPKEEINHPSRYAGGKYECIEVMKDVFGVEATKHFCLLNAFKYIWRQEHKNGVEDIKKEDRKSVV